MNLGLSRIQVRLPCYVRGITLGSFSSRKKVLASPLEPGTRLPSQTTCHRYVFWPFPSPLPFPFPFCLRWQENPLPSTNPTDVEPRARAPTRAPSLYVIGYLHLCRVTGSFAGLLLEEAEAIRPSQSCFVRGSLAVLWPAAPPLPSLALPRRHRRSLVGR